MFPQLTVGRDWREGGFSQPCIIACALVANVGVFCFMFVIA